MKYTKQQLEEKILEHFPEIEDACLEFLWARYQENPDNAHHYAGMYWLKDDIRPFNDEERQRPIERERANNAT